MTKRKKNKRTNNDLQNIMQNTKEVEPHMHPLNTGDELG